MGKRKILLCSECFQDQGLRLCAFRLGIEGSDPCPQCNTTNGRKLDKRATEALAYGFFVGGTVHKVDYGGSFLVQCNESHYRETDLNFSNWLKNDVKLIEEATKLGFFLYAPRMWMVGFTEPLKSLQNEEKRSLIINQILKKYPTRIFFEGESFFRLRSDNPENAMEPYNPLEYDTPPSINKNSRFSSDGLPVMYGSQDLEVCVHECRVSIEDNLFMATLAAKRELRLLDLTASIKEENVTEFESLELSMHMLFAAGKYSYDISKSIAQAAHKEGFDGLIYPSYFSSVHTGIKPFNTVIGTPTSKIAHTKSIDGNGIIPNLALFGRPIKEGTVEVKSMNRVILNSVGYDLSFGPVQF